MFLDHFSYPDSPHWYDLSPRGCDKFAIDCRSSEPRDVTLSQAEAADDTRAQFVMGGGERVGGAGRAGPGQGCPQRPAPEPPEGD